MWHKFSSSVHACEGLYGQSLCSPKFMTTQTEHVNCKYSKYSRDSLVARCSSQQRGWQHWRVYLPILKEASPPPYTQTPPAATPSWHIPDQSVHINPLPSNSWWDNKKSVLSQNVRVTDTVMWLLYSKCNPLNFSLLKKGISNMCCSVLLSNVF